MMAKIVKGASFGGVVKYILDPQKQTNLLDSDGVRLKTIDTIAQSFETQRELNPRVSRPVGHISLDFSAQDRGKLTDQIMTRIAHDYMSRMGIVNTQFIIGRHHDKEHPHLHIAFNRIDNQGRTITDKNDRFRSEKICKELTEEYGLYFASGKENVKEHRLKEPDKTKYEIYNALKRAVPDCHNWQELSAQLQRDGIAVEFKMRSGTNEPQGVKFSKNGYHFNGSKVDKQFSYSKIDYQLNQNQQTDQSVKQFTSKRTDCFTDKPLNYFTEQSDSLSGLFSVPLSDNSATDPDEEAFRRAMQRKKKKGIRR
ncbi:MAG: relaxase/mobilization nuclease domain-containing protein [Bacteroidales bacterium]|nr:relaxase/mobilization nuclease domain-containing protein [Bacteroidales bacterium]